MRQEITRISVIQTSKVIAILYIPFELLLSLLGFWMLVAIPMDDKTQLIAIAYLVAPLWYTLIVFVCMLLICWIYNVIAPWFGGIEFEVRNLGRTKKDLTET